MKGWYGDKHRHKLASKGVKTKYIMETGGFKVPEYVWVVQYYSGEVGGMGDIMEEIVFLNEEDAKYQKDLEIFQHGIPEEVRKNMDNLIVITRRKYDKLTSLEKREIDRQIEEEMDYKDDIDELSQADAYYDYCASNRLDISNRDRG